jgi:hypothetical protein
LALIGAALVAGCDQAATTPAERAVSAAPAPQPAVDVVAVWGQIGLPCDDPLIVRDLPNGESPAHMPDFNQVRADLAQVRTTQPEAFVHDRLQGLFAKLLGMQNSMKGVVLTSHDPDYTETVLHAMRRDFDLYEKSMIHDVETGTKKTDTAIALSAVCPGM